MTLNLNADQTTDRDKWCLSYSEIKRYKAATIKYSYLCCLCISPRVTLEWSRHRRECVCRYHIVGFLFPYRWRKVKLYVKFLLGSTPFHRIRQHVECGYIEIESSIYFHRINLTHQITDKTMQRTERRNVKTHFTINYGWEFLFWWGTN